MLICYVNEAGCSGELPAADSPVQPLLAILGITLPAAGLEGLTRAFADWKIRFFPGLTRGLASPLEAMLVGIPGKELRRAVRRGPQQRRFAIRALSELLALLEREEARLLGRVWIKGIDEPFNRRAILSSSLQTIFDALDDLCEKRGETGWIVTDAAHRLPGEALSQQIFSRRWEGRGGQRLAELPTSGHRDNHAGLQIAELLCSGLLFPLAAHSFCRGHLTASPHLSDRYAALKEHFGARLEKLQHRYAAPDGRWTGGLVVSDPLGGRPGSQLFR